MNLTPKEWLEACCAVFLLAMAARPVVKVVRILIDSVRIARATYLEELEREGSEAIDRREA